MLSKEKKVLPIAPASIYGCGQNCASDPQSFLSIIRNRGDECLEDPVIDLSLESPIFRRISLLSLGKVFVQTLRANEY